MTFVKLSSTETVHWCESIGDLLISWKSNCEDKSLLAHFEYVFTLVLTLLEGFPSSQIGSEDYNEQISWYDRLFLCPCPSQRHFQHVYLRTREEGDGTGGWVRLEYNRRCLGKSRQRPGNKYHQGGVFTVSNEDPNRDSSKGRGPLKRVTLIRSRRIRYH